MNSRKKQIITAAVLIILFFIAASVINHMQINAAVNACIETNGTPQVDKDLFAFNWHFSCGK
ncbi:hypothetical protein LC040_02905 [Bacillus tianshenii]|nr:hypothetical protein LC040_02905 [Bacillus tianshenii]